MATPINLLKINLLEIPGATAVIANAINDHGQVVGQFQDKNGVGHGFLFQQGSFCQIDYPEASSTSLLGINNLGHIVGMMTKPAGTFGFVYDRGTFSPPISFPGSTNFTIANAINDRGEIVGVFQSSVPGGHSFLFQAGRFQELSYPNSTETSVEDINENGQIVGNFPDAKGTHGFVYLENVGVFTPPLDCEGVITTLRGINNEGQIVGGCLDKQGNERPFLYMAAALNVIRIPTSVSGSVNGINNRGQIVGNFRDKSESHSYIGALPT